MLAGLSSAVFVLRSFAVSGFDTTAALSILTGGGLSGLVGGTVLTVLPFLAPVGLVLLLARQQGLIGESMLRRIVVWNGLVPLTLLLTLVASPISIIVLVLVVAVAWLATARWRAAYARIAGFYLGGIVAVLVFTLILWGPSWLPPEQITVGREEVVGYVVGDSGGWTTILDAETHLVTVVRNEAVVSRQPCNLRAGLAVWQQSVLDLARRAGLAELFGAGPGSPPCPTTP